MPAKKKVLFKVDQGKPVKVTVDINQGLKDRLDSINEHLGQRNNNESLDLQDHVPEFIENLVSKAEKELGLSGKPDGKKSKAKPLSPQSTSQQQAEPAM